MASLTPVHGSKQVALGIMVKHSVRDNSVPCSTTRAAPAAAPSLQPHLQHCVEVAGVAVVEHAGGQLAVVARGRGQQRQRLSEAADIHLRGVT